MNYHDLKVRMDLPLLHARPELSKENLGLLDRPAHNLRQQIQSPALRPLRDMQQIPPSQFFHMRISRPPIDRNLVHSLFDIFEPYVTNIRRQVPNLVERFTETLRCFVEEIAPLRQDVFFGQRAIVGFELDAHFHFVEVAAWLEVVVDLCVERWPVTDGAVQGADVDEVKGLGVCPWEGYVVDFEFAVWRRELRLDGGEVYAEDLGAGVFWYWVGHDVLERDCRSCSR